MGIESRLRKLEGRPRVHGPAACPECAGKIIYVERLTDGTVTYPFDPPCSTCKNVGPGVRRIEVVTEGV